MGQRLLLDTHAVIWWATDQSRLSSAAFEAIENGENDVFVSPVSAMEIATKVRIGKLEDARPLACNFLRQMEQHGFSELPLVSAHAERAGGLPIENQDPWDRLLIAQAQVERLRFVSNEKQFDSLAVHRLW